MSRRRRRWFRAENLAPWLTLTVILGLWALGARALSPGRDAVVGAAPSAPAHPWEPEGEVSPGRPTNPTPAARATPADPGKPLIPVAGVDVSALRSSFDEARGGGSRRHEAMDILAPRGTPVLAAVDGRIAKLFTSAAGGLTIYQFDPDEAHCYYYAHLDSYEPDLAEGAWVVRGQVIGYVGTTGNAPPDTPHLHFAIYRLTAERRWWDGEPIDPFLLLR